LATPISKGRHSKSFDEVLQKGGESTMDTKVMEAAEKKEALNGSEGESTQNVPAETERLSLGVDVGTSHCEVVAYSKRADKFDEEKYHFGPKPITTRCWSSLILFSKNNEGSLNYVQKFFEDYNIPPQEEYIGGEKIPFVFFDQVERLLAEKKLTEEQLDILKRSTNVHYPLKTKTRDEEYSDIEKAVIRLNVEKILTPFVKEGLALDIAFAKPCEAGANYNSILMDAAAKVVNKNRTNDNRFIIRSEAVFTGHYLLNMQGVEDTSIAVCDIGAGTGDVYVFDQDDSKTKVMKTFLTAGNAYTKNLVSNLMVQCNVDISERDANLLKEKVGFISGYTAPKAIRPVVADLYISGKPRKVRIGKSLDEAARPMAKEAVKTLVEIFQDYDGLHPRTVALTGYQGQLEGLDTAIQEGMALEGYEVQVKNLRAYAENDPRSIVAKGAENFSRMIRNGNWVIL
jgi:MreB/Mbl protein